MPVATANGLALAYESTGEEGAPAILLVMGFAMPLSLWPDAFVNGLAAEGFRVVTFDNRDVGHSQRIPSGPLPNAMWGIAKVLMGLPVKGAYTLEDMADDAAGLLDALGIAKAHVVGMSMGGMIAQAMAGRHPARVTSLTSIMSSSGNRRVSLGRPRALKAILKRPPDPGDRQAVVRHLEYVIGVISSRRYPPEPAMLRALCERVADRGLDSKGAERQLFAILASGDRRADLAKVSAPTLVIHGEDDPLLRIDASRDIAAHIAGSRFMPVEGMAHDLPMPLMPMLVSAIAAHCRAAQAMAVPASAPTPEADGTPAPTPP